MSFLKRMLISDIQPTAAERDIVDASKHELNEARGEYRQAVQRLESNARVMSAWENANRMVRE